MDPSNPFWDAGFLPGSDGLNSGLPSAGILSIFLWVGFGFLYVMINQLHHLKIDHLYGSDPVRYYPVISKPSWFLSLHCDVRTARLPDNVFLSHYLRMFPQPIHVYALELGRRTFSSILVHFEK